jgi:CBS domain-containing protein
MDFYELLKHTPPFSNLRGEQLRECVPHLSTRTYPKGTYIFRQGEPHLEYLFFVLSGLVEILLVGEDGEERTVGLLKAGDFFGECLLFTDSYPTTSKTVEDTHCLLIPEVCFEELKSDPDFIGFFSHALAERMRYVYQEVAREQSCLVPWEPRHYRRRLYEIMSSPVVTCLKDNRITEVAQLFAEQQDISSVVILDRSGTPRGILTAKDLVRRVLGASDFKNRLSQTAAALMTEKLVTLPPEAHVYEALLGMVRNQVRHVLVESQGLLLGMVTMGDLVRAQHLDVLRIVDTVNRAPNVKAIAAHMTDIDRIITELVFGDASAEEICTLVTEFYDCITRRLIRLAEEEMLLEGKGRPPTSYCWLTMGSGGRREQILRTDQDSALIYDDPQPGEEEKTAAFFLDLGRRVVSGLEQCGFELCRDQVVASSPEWCKPMREWFLALTRWTLDLNPQVLRLMNIFLDFRPVYGQFAMARSLRRYFYQRLKQAPAVLHFMTRDTLSRRVPLNPFRQVVTERSGPHKDELDLKRAALIHIVDSVRLFALREELLETSTPGRLRQLVDKEVLPKDDAEAFAVAYDSILMLRLRENLRRIAEGKKPCDYLNPRELTRRELAVLKDALLAVSRLQKLTAVAFRVEGL